MRTAVKAEHEDLHKDILEIRDMRLRKKLPKVPPKYADRVVAYPTPDIGKLIDAGQSLLATKMPTLHRAPTDAKSTPSRKRAEKIERWFNEGAYVRMRKDRDWFPMVTDSLAEGGHGIWKCRLLKHAWGEALKDDDSLEADEYNAKAQKVRRGYWPFAAEHVPTTSFFPLAYDSAGCLVEAMEITMRKKPVLLSVFEDDLKKAGAVTEAEDWIYGEAECMEYWNTDTFEFWIDDTMVKSGKHRGGYPPYFHAMFSPTGIHDIRHQTTRLVDQIVDDCALFADFMTKKSAWAGMASYPIFKMEAKSLDDVLPYDDKYVIEWAEGETTDIPPGHSWDPQVIPGTGADLNQVLSILRQSIDENSLAAILYGKGSGEMSGPVQQTAVQLARARFGPALESFSRELNRMASYMLRLIDTELKTVPVWVKATGEWLELTSEDIEEFYDVDHVPELIIKMAEVVEYTEAKDQHQSGYVDAAYVRSKIPGVKYPEEMADRKFVEGVVDSQQMMTLLIGQTLAAIKAEEEEPPPTEVEGVPVTAGPVPAGVPTGGPTGAGMVRPPGIGNQPVAPGMNPALMPANGAVP